MNIEVEQPIKETQSMANEQNHHSSQNLLLSKGLPSLDGNVLSTEDEEDHCVSHQREPMDTDDIHPFTNDHERHGIAKQYQQVVPERMGAHAVHDPMEKIGRASCRERV